MNTQTSPTQTPTSEESNGLGLSKGRVVALVAALIMTVLSFQLNASMITPALPSIAEDLNVSINEVSQVSTIFLLFGSIGGILLIRWSDYVGRRNVLFVILGALLVGSLLALFAPNLPVLLVGRAMQGISSAAFQISYLVLDEALSPKAFGAALGLITALNGGVGGVDGYFGGLLAENFGYRSLFVVILGFTAIALVAVILTFPKNMKTTSTGKFDWIGGVLITAGFVCLNKGISAGSSADHGWTSPKAIILLVVAVTSLVLFWIRQQRASSPLITVDELKSRQVWPVIAGVLFTLAGVYPVINFTMVVLSQNSQIGFGMSASISSLFFLVPPAVIGIVAAPVVGWIAPRIGWILTLRIGLVICVAALVVIMLFPTNFVLCVAMIAVLGVGYNGLALTTLNALGVLLSPEDSKGALPAMSGACFGLGSSIGIALISPFASADAVSGVRMAMAISLAITVVALIATLLMRAPEGKKV